MLAVYSKVVERGLVHLVGPWSNVLGDDPAGFVRFNRLFDVSGKFVCYSEFYISATRFGGILNRPNDGREAANLRKILAAEFRTPTLYLRQRARVEPLTERICELLAIDRGSSGMKLELIGHGFEDAPISYQTIWIPPTHYLLDLSRVRPFELKE
ncbi:MAG TPA: UTRA domain-containing protein [Chloroflexota bacterium]|nr:UTRA domain-containing protein [Chloroflexota bacterium]